MSVLQNINGSLYRMDASDLVQLAAVDTEGILGGTPGATTNGQTLVDQLAADDVQAQTDIGQIKTDLSDYHVTPSPNLCPYPYGSERGFILSDGSIQYGDTGYISDFISLTSSQYVFSASIHGAAAFRVCWYNNSKAFISRENTNVSPTTFTVPQNAEYVRLCYEDTVSENKYLTNTMFCTKEYWDAHPSYVPYWACMRDGMFPRSEQAVLGAKNLLHYPYYTGSNTLNAVTYTVNSDGTVRVVANSTTVYSSMTLCRDLMSVLKPDVVYALNGAPVKPSSATYRQPELRIRKNSNNDVIRSDLGQGATFSITSAMANADTYRLDIAVFETSTFDFTFKPMIRLASDPDDTYVPFAMTNAELTGKNTPIFIPSTDDINNYYGADKHGQLYYWNIAPNNSPESKSYCFMKVLHHPANLDKQLILWFTTPYIRERNGSGVWTTSKVTITTL